LAKKPPPEHTRWKPGESGNKAGKVKNLLTQDSVKKLISQFSEMTEVELKEIAENPNTPWKEKALATQMLQAPENLGALNFVLERSIGKVKDVKEISVVPKPTIIQKRDGSQIVLGSELKQLESGEDN
jgi:hypothetical protein